MRLAAKALRTAEEEELEEEEGIFCYYCMLFVVLFIYYNIVRRRRQQKKIKICHRSEKYGQAYSTGGAGRVGHYPRECDSALFTSSMLKCAIGIDDRILCSQSTFIEPITRAYIVVSLRTNCKLDDART